MNKRTLQQVCAGIVPVSAEFTAAARARLDTLTKPLGSLGRLEDIAVQWASIRRDKLSEPIRKAVYVFAADHGVTAEGVSAYPRAVTQQMVLNFLAKGAAVNVLARQHHAVLQVVDVGVDADFGAIAGLVDRKVARGTANMLVEPAMTGDQLQRALAAGMEQADEAASSGYSLVAVGEMGIGNTTSAAVITCALTGASAELATGSGTGVTMAARAHKVEVVTAVLDRHFEQAPVVDAVEILRKVGGLEIAAMTGLMLGAARHNIAIVCDGFISTAAAALAAEMAPEVRGYLFAGHESVEPGHRLLLQHLRLEPLLSLGMRLGEGTGAVLAMPVIEAAVALYVGMATFASAGVSEVTA